MKHEQHRQGHGGQSNPASNQTATQPGDPGAAPPLTDLSSDAAAPGTLHEDWQKLMSEMVTEAAIDEGRAYFRRGWR